MQQGAIGGLGLVLIAAAFVVYARIVLRLRRVGGRVAAECFDLPDLLVSIVLGSFFGGLVVQTILQHVSTEPMKPEQVLPGSLLQAVFVIGLGLFLTYRGLLLGEIFGFRRLRPAAVAGWSVLLLFAAFPFVAVVNAVTLLVLKNDAERQPLVELFRAAVERGDVSTMGIIAIAGVLIAPLCEEFLFRGYFYGVGKRYAGAWISGLVTAALFAVFHASLTSLAGLFVLAIALTLAYERTGSLAVPITMHALFNATSLGVLYLQATNRLPT